MKKWKGLKEDSESFFKGVPFVSLYPPLMKEYLTSAWLKIWFFRAAMAASKRSFVLCFWFSYQAFAMKKFLKKRRKRDGVRRNWLLGLGKKERKIDNGEGENEYARQQRDTMDTIFIIRTCKNMRPSNESLF